MSFMVNEQVNKRVEAVANALHLNDQQIQDLFDMGYFFAPASSKFHGNYRGGLFEHSHAVACQLGYMTDAMHLNWSRPESPYIIGYLHDLCKCDEYEEVEGDVWVRSKDQLIVGHGDKSVMLAHKILQLTEEEMLCIRYHMGAYQTEDWNGYDLAIKKNENVLWTHTADMFASKVIGL